MAYVVYLTIRYVSSYRSGSITYTVMCPRTTGLQSRMQRLLEQHDHITELLRGGSNERR